MTILNRFEAYLGLAYLYHPGALAKHVFLTMGGIYCLWVGKP